MKTKDEIVELPRSLDLKSYKTQPKYTVLNDTVLVKRCDIADDAASDIAKNAFEVTSTLSNKGLVIAVDPADPVLKVGDTVLFSEHAANDVELDGEKFLLLNRKQVYLKL
jgi:co-chaperonin GroES (HSP10)